MTNDPLGPEEQGPGRERLNRTMTLAAFIGRRIVSGAIPEGTALPTEKDLQSDHGVSRTVVREAMRHLSAKGLVSVGPKVGTRVRERTAWNMLDGDVMSWHMAGVPQSFVQALYEMRLINEPEAARRAAARISPEQAGRLAQALEGMARNPRGTPELIAADLAFHRIILEASGNPILVSLGTMIEHSLAISFTMSWRQSPQDETVRQHRGVMDAIVAGDGEAASLFMRRLIESAFNDVTASLFGRDKPGGPASGTPRPMPRAAQAGG